MTRARAAPDLDLRRLFVVTGLAPKSEIARRVGPALTPGDHVVELEIVGGPAVNATAPVTAPDLASDRLRNRRPPLTGVRPQGLLDLGSSAGGLHFDFELHSVPLREVECDPLLCNVDRTLDNL